MDGILHIQAEGVLCETCIHCENGCASTPDSHVRDCQDYEEKLGYLFKRVEDRLGPCLDCEMAPNCTLPGPNGQPGQEMCAYHTPIKKSKPDICKSCAFQARSCIPNQGENCTEFKQKKDEVNHPDHYTQGGIECIQCIEAAMKPEGFQDYCKGNIIKYLHRWRDKGGVQDLKKASVYLNWLIESAEKGKISYV